LHQSQEQAIAPELCAQLIDEFPDLATVVQGQSAKSNERFSYSASLALHNQQLSPLWREFVATHVSQDFLDQLIALFRGQIQLTYPNFEQDFERLARIEFHSFFSLIKQRV
jgi:hypothetical protein